MIKTLDKITDWIVIIAMIIIFLFGAYIVYDTLYVYSGASFRGTMTYKPDSAENTAEMKELSDDVVAWVVIDDTGVDFPIMQGETNSQYLNINPYGEYAIGGSIFMDVRNSADFSDDYNVIYGHHMEGKTMFGTLDYFSDEEYFNSHRKGKLLTVDGKEYELEVFAYGVGDVSDEELFDLDKPFTIKDRLDYIKRTAIYYFEPTEHHYMAMTTCKKPSGTDRTFVICSIINQNEGDNPDTPQKP